MLKTLILFCIIYLGLKILNILIGAVVYFQKTRQYEKQTKLIDEIINLTDEIINLTKEKKKEPACELCNGSGYIMDGDSIESNTDITKEFKLVNCPNCHKFEEEK